MTNYTQHLQMFRTPDTDGAIIRHPLLGGTTTFTHHPSGEPLSPAEVEALYNPPGDVVEGRGWGPGCTTCAHNSTLHTAQGCNKYMSRREDCTCKGWTQ